MVNKEDTKVTYGSGVGNEVETGPNLGGGCCFSLFFGRLFLPLDDLRINCPVFLAVPCGQ